MTNPMPCLMKPSTVTPINMVSARATWGPGRPLSSGLGSGSYDETGIPTHTPGTVKRNVPGIDNAGVLAAEYNANKIFIENGKLHGPKIVEAVVSSLPDF